MNTIIYKDVVLKHILDYENKFDNYEKQEVNKAFKKLEDLLNFNDNKKILYEYDNCIKTYFENLRDEVCEYCLLKGIQIGLELSKNFQEIKEEEDS